MGKEETSCFNVGPRRLALTTLAAFDLQICICCCFQTSLPLGNHIYLIYQLIILIFSRSYFNPSFTTNKIIILLVVVILLTLVLRSALSTEAHKGHKKRILRGH